MSRIKYIDKEKNNSTHGKIAMIWPIFPKRFMIIKILSFRIYILWVNPSWMRISKIQFSVADALLTFLDDIFIAQIKIYLPAILSLPPLLTKNCWFKFLVEYSELDKCNLNRVWGVLLSIDILHNFKIESDLPVQFQ